MGCMGAIVAVPTWWQQGPMSDDFCQEPNRAAVDVVGETVRVPAESPLCLTD